MHTHTSAGIAVAAQEQGLLPISQHVMRLTGNVAYHDYEGVAIELDEQKRLESDLGECKTMVLRNHDLLTCGATVREAFDFMYYLERARREIASSADRHALLAASACPRDDTECRARRNPVIAREPKQSRCKQRHGKGAMRCQVI